MAPSLQGGVADLSAEVVWGSTSPTVFTVDASGMAKAGSVGSASVTASLLGISAVSGIVQVSNATLTGMVVDPGYIQAPTGGLGQYRAVGVFSDGTTQDVSTDALWTSSNPAVLELTPSVFANALMPGNVTVTATLLGLSASTQQNTVVAATLQSVAIIPSTPTIAVNTSEQLGLVGTCSNGTLLDLTSCANGLGACPIRLSSCPRSDRCDHGRHFHHHRLVRSQFHMHPSRHRSKNLDIDRDSSG